MKIFSIYQQYKFEKEFSKIKNYIKKLSKYKCVLTLNDIKEFNENLNIQENFIKELYNQLTFKMKLKKYIPDLNNYFDIKRNVINIFYLDNKKIKKIRKKNKNNLIYYKEYKIFIYKDYLYKKNYFYLNFYINNYKKFNNKFKNLLKQKIIEKLKKELLFILNEKGFENIKEINTYISSIFDIKENIEVLKHRHEFFLFFFRTNNLNEIDKKKLLIIEEPFLKHKLKLKKEFLKKFLETLNINLNYDLIILKKEG